MKKLSIILLILCTLAFGAFFKRQETVEYRGWTCDIMTKSIAGYDIAIAVSVDAPYELLWMKVRNPEGCLSTLEYTGFRYEKKN